MLAGFDWWLLVVGIVAGGGLVWLLLADFRRDDADMAAREVAREAEWIAERVSAERAEGSEWSADPEQAAPIDRASVERVLELHRAYLGASAPDLDELDDDAWYEAHAESVAVEGMTHPKDD